MADKVIIDRKKLEKIEADNENLREAAVKLQNGLFMAECKYFDGENTVRIVGKEDALFGLKQIAFAENKNTHLDQIYKMNIEFNDTAKSKDEQLDILEKLLQEKHEEIRKLENKLKPWWKIF